MVKLQSLSLTNFMTIEQLDLQFDDKIVMMIGGQNGGGKSTVLYAIALALFEHKKGDSYKDYVRVGSQSATIKLQALYNGSPILYELKITTSKYGVPLTRTIQYRGKVYNNSECKLLLKELDSEYLEHAMFLLQNDSSIVDLRPSERARLLKKVLHFEFDDQVAVLKGRMDQEALLQTTLGIRLEEMQKRKFPRLELLDESDVANAAELRGQLAQIDRQLASMEDFDATELADADSSLEEATRSLREQTEQLQDSQKLLASKQAQLQQLQSLQAEDLPFVRDEALVEAAENLRASQAEASTALVSYRIASEASVTLQKQLEISKKGLCHSCGHKIEPGHIEKLSKELAAAENKTQELQGVLQKAQRDSDLALATVNLLQSRKKAWQVNHDESLRRAATCAALQESIVQLKSTEKAQKATIKSSSASVRFLQQKAASLSSHKEASEKRAQLLLHKSLIEKRLLDIGDVVAINAERRRSNLEAENAEKQHEQDKQQLALQLNNSARNVDLLKRGISIFENEFPNFIILRTCARLEGYINNFIQKLFPYMAVRLQPSRSGVEFYYTAAAAEDEWLSVKMASGAQAAVLTLAWRVAIAKLYGMSTILLDEVDAAATEENAALIYQFIASLDTFDQIIFVSHKKEAMKAIASMMDNVVCYYVKGGEYSLVDATELSDGEDL